MPLKKAEKYSTESEGGGAMIKNSTQLALTKSKLDEFNAAIHAIEEVAIDAHPLLVQAQKNALIFQRDDLLSEIEESEGEK